MKFRATFILLSAQEKENREALDIADGLARNGLQVQHIMFSIDPSQVGNMTFPVLHINHDNWSRTREYEGVREIRKFGDWARRIRARQLGLL